MTAEKIRAGRSQIIERYGPWTAHDIALGHGVSTMDMGLHQQWRVDWFSRLITQFGTETPPRSGFLARFGVGRSSPKAGMEGLRLLDLACLEGMFAIEFARLGATTVGLEIRQAHLAKAKFANQTIGLQKCRFVQGDVRSIPKNLGRFQVIICAGILYHLDFPDCVTFIQDIAMRSDDLVIIDSHFAYDDIADSVLPLSEMRTYELGNRTFRGRAITEHAGHVTTEEKASQHLWASIDNDVSVWLDERDVITLMDQEGFTLVHKGFPFEEYRAHNPNRPTLVFKRTA